MRKQPRASNTKVLGFLSKDSFPWAAVRRDRPRGYAPSVASPMNSVSFIGSPRAAAAGGEAAAGPGQAGVLLLAILQGHGRERPVCLRRLSCQRRGRRRDWSSVLGRSAQAGWAQGRTPRPASWSRKPAPPRTAKRRLHPRRRLALPESHFAWAAARGRAGDGHGSPRVENRRSFEGAAPSLPRSQRCYVRQVYGTGETMSQVE